MVMVWMCSSSRTNNYVFQIILQADTMSKVSE